MSSHARARRRRTRRRGPGPAFLFLGLIGALVGIVGLSAVGYVLSIAADAPSLEGVKANDQGASSVVYASHGERLGFIQSSVLRSPVPSTEIPPAVRQATVAIEDSRFWRHHGVDAEGVARAAVKNVESGHTVEGGSTITMQLARALYLNRDRSFKRKIQEARIATELEQRHDKHWILNEYLNNAPYGTNGGQSAIGIQAAARTYFDKPAARLDLAEAAMLAGLPQAPSEYNPFLDPTMARARRNQVLDAMVKNHMVRPETAAAAKARPLGTKKGRFYTTRRENFFFDYVKQELIRRYGVERVRRGGLSVYTTIDLKKQQAARAAIAANLPPGPSSAIVTIDPKNGHILAMASSARYADSKFNLAAQGRRQAGSTFKVMGLMAALRKGINPESTSYTSKRLMFNDPRYGPIDVDCYSGCTGQRLNLVQATLKSDNSVYQQLALDIGPDAVKQAARDMGITSPLFGYPGEILGGLKYGVSPLEMARAYATVASGGIRRKPIAITKVRFADGRTVNLDKPQGKRTFDEGVAAKATQILEANVRGGTGTKAQIGCPAAGKTGTVDEFVDAWFAGYTPNLVSVVWMGYPGRRISMPGVAGGTYPAQIWGAYMRQVHRGCKEFTLGGRFTSSPFYSHSAPGAAPVPGTTTAPATPGAPAPATPPPSTGTGGGATGGGGTGGGGTGGSGNGDYSNNDLYETPPQGAPDSGATGGASPGN